MIRSLVSSQAWLRRWMPGIFSTLHHTRPFSYFTTKHTKTEDIAKYISCQINIVFKWQWYSINMQKYVLKKKKKCLSGKTQKNQQQNVPFDVFLSNCFQSLVGTKGPLQLYFPVSAAALRKHTHNSSLGRLWQNHKIDTEPLYHVCATSSLSYWTMECPSGRSASPDWLAVWYACVCLSEQLIESSSPEVIILLRIKPKLKADNSH